MARIKQTAARKSTSGYAPGYEWLKELDQKLNRNKVTRLRQNWGKFRELQGMVRISSSLSISWWCDNQLDAEYGFLFLTYEYWKVEHIRMLSLSTLKNFCLLMSGVWCCEITRLTQILGSLSATYDYDLILC